MWLWLLLGNVALLLSIQRWLSRGIFNLESLPPSQVRIGQKGSIPGEELLSVLLPQPSRDSTFSLPRRGPNASISSLPPLGSPTLPELRDNKEGKHGDRLCPPGALSPPDLLLEFAGSGHC